MPDATSLLRFRRLLEAHKLDEASFARVDKELQAQGIKVHTGTIVDAMIRCIRRAKANSGTSA